MNNEKGMMGIGTILVALLITLSLSIMTIAINSSGSLFEEAQSAQNAWEDAERAQMY